MKLVVQREVSVGDATLGKLYINGEYLCDTLEDVIREVPGQPVANWKVHGKTAIPAGIYKVTLEDSPKFGKATLTVNHVPGFSLIRIHAGNSASDTEGCLVVGSRASATTLYYSRIALAKLKTIVMPSIAAKEEVYIQYINP